MFSRTVAFSITALLGVALTQAAVLWSPSSGTAPGGEFMYSGGSNDVGLFGDPTILSNGFLMEPDAYDVSNGEPAAEDNFEVLITSLDGPRDLVFVREWIYINIVGDGSVTVTGNLQLGSFVSTGNTAFQSQTFTDPGEYTVMMEWVASAPSDAINALFGQTQENFQMTFTNTLSATASTGSAYASKVRVGTTMPEPTSLVALVAGFAILGLRRR